MILLTCKTLRETRLRIKAVRDITLTLTLTLPQISNLGLFFSVFSVFLFFFGFFSVFPFCPILTGLTGSCEVVLDAYDSFYKTFAGLSRRNVCY